MTDNKPDLYELSALLQRQGELVEQMADRVEPSKDESIDRPYGGGYIALIGSHLELLNTVLQQVVDGTVTPERKDKVMSVLEQAKTQAVRSRQYFTAYIEGDDDKFLRLHEEDSRDRGE